MELHDYIAKELLEQRSLAALCWLIERGRELEFVYDGKEYFISCDKSKRYVSLWLGKEEQSFDTVEDLIENAVLDGRTFLSVWPDIVIVTLF